MERKAIPRRLRSPPRLRRPSGGQETPVFSTFAGAVQLVDIKVKVGDEVKKGQTIAVVEAMKATHDIKVSFEGKVTAVHAKIGDEVDASKPIVTIAKRG
jgi:biotin carboxyl carrier protein